MVWHKETETAPGPRHRWRAGWVFLWRLPALRGPSQRNRRSCGRWAGFAGQGRPCSGHLQRLSGPVRDAGLLPGALMRNAGLKFVLPHAGVAGGGTTDCAFTSGYKPGQDVVFPIAHHDGNYQIDAEGLARLEGEDRIAFTYVGNPKRGDGGYRGHPVGEPARAWPDAASRNGSSIRRRAAAMAQRCSRRCPRRWLRP